MAWCLNLLVERNGPDFNPRSGDAGDECILLLLEKSGWPGARDGVSREVTIPCSLNGRICSISFSVEQVSGVHIICACTVALCTRCLFRAARFPPSSHQLSLNLGLAVLGGRHRGQDPPTQLKGTAMAGLEGCSR